MDGSDDIFDTPRMRCLKLKSEFLRKARNYKFWGFKKSRQRVTALDTFARYCRQSMEVAKYETKLMNDVREDIHNFMLEERVLPLPHALREKLSSAKDANEEQFGPFCLEIEALFIRDELENLRDEALAEFENEEWSSQEEFYQYAFELRSLRKRIYEGANIFFDIQEYEFEVESFLEKYQKILGKREVGIWKRKVKDTIKFAEGILGYSMSDAVEESNEIVENDSESIVITQVKLENPPEETFQVTSLVPDVQEVFEAAQYQESLVENLPNVPDTDEFFVCQNSVDLDIEARLLKLKFFRRTWCCSEPSGETEPGEMTPPVVAKLSKPKGNVAAVIDVPIYSTKEDVKDFNNWYLEQIGVLVPPTTDIWDDKEKPCKAEPGGVQKVLDLKVNPTAPMTPLQAKVKSDSPKQDESIDKDPIFMPSVDMNEQVVHPMPLPSSYTSNYIKRVNMENMLVMFLTFLRMLYFAQPKLSCVPTVFPSQTQSLPDPSIPSSACGTTMSHMEVRLAMPSCQAVGQVISDLTRGSMSWLRDTIWQILQRRKIAAGLRFIQVGEMLLA